MARSISDEDDHDTDNYNHDNNDDKVRMKVVEKVTSISGELVKVALQAVDQKVVEEVVQKADDRLRQEVGIIAGAIDEAMANMVAEVKDVPALSRGFRRSSRPWRWQALAATRASLGLSSARISGPADRLEGLRVRRCPAGRMSTTSAASLTAPGHIGMGFENAQRA